MTGPLVSIIIPVYNSAQYLEATIASALNQTWMNKELIIVDDGSTDDSFEIAKKYESEKVKIVHQINKGASAARNLGLSIANGDFIQYLDGDDLLPPNKIEIQLAILIKNPECIISCNWVRFKKNINQTFSAIGPDEALRKDLKPLDWLKARHTMLLHCWLSPKMLIEKAGPWDEEISFNDDGEYFARVIQHSEKIIYCGDTIVYYRTESQNSISKLNTNRKFESAFQAAVSFEKVIKKLGPKDQSIYKTIGNNFKEILYFSYPKHIGVYNQCKQQDSLKYADLSFNAGGFGGKIIKFLFGWKTIRLLKYWSRHYKKNT